MKKQHIFKINKIIVIALSIVITMSFRSSESDVRYKCMIQMVNYIGENAYVVISLITPDNTYDNTLYVAGRDDEWYHDIIRWWKYQKIAKDKLDGITGASIAGGQRTVALLTVPTSKIDKGYKIRFESAVEGQVYHNKDIEFELSTSNVDKKIEGTGYIRYVRLMRSN